MELAAIVYTSATGFTRQYAGLLSAACGLPAMALKGAVPPPGPVLYLGWLRAGSVQGLRAARRRFPVAGVCAVGMAPPEQADLERLRRANTPACVSWIIGSVVSCLTTYTPLTLTTAPAIDGMLVGFVIHFLWMKIKLHPTVSE